jgi:hypothetical protein
VFSCNYNGWADVPEEEREGVEAYEAASALEAVPPPRATVPVSLVLRAAGLPARSVPQRKAA